jgi:hypothetical protein
MRLCGVNELLLLFAVVVTGMMDGNDGEADAVLYKIPASTLSSCDVQQQSA